MWKEKVLSARDFIVRNSKFVFPFIVIAVVAITVCAALKAGNAKGDLPEEESSVAVESSEQVVEPVNTEVPLVKNEDAEIAALIESYYTAMAEGNEEVLRGICDEITDKDMLRYVETAKYTKAYTTLEVYTKPGLESGTTIAYVYYKAVFEGYEDEFPGYQAHYICTDDQGELYFKRSENNEEVNEYVKRVSSQNDVVEFNNRINVEYNELIEQKPELLVYLQQLDSQVSTAVGEGLANLAQQAESEQQTEGTENTQQGTGENQAEGIGGNVTQFATATTTVNVRSSDSEQADKLGKVAGGEKIQVLEQRLNGWSKVLYENKEGFIKSEYLQVGESTESAEGVASNGKVTATTNINVRAKASETAEKIGTLLGGDSAELISTENGWCKIKFNGQIAYVKAEFVQ